MYQKKYIILTGGDGGWGNLGDEFLEDAVKGFYKKYLNKYKIIILKGNPKNKKDGFIYVKDDLGSFEAAGINLSDIVLVHYYGGGYLNKYWFGRKIWFYRHLVSKKFDPRKIIFTGQGLGPFTAEDEVEIREIIGKSQAFYMRDFDKQYHNLGAQFSFDESIGLVKPKRVSFKRKIIALHVRPEEDFAGQNHIFLENLLNKTNTFARQNGYRLVMLPMLESEVPKIHKLLKETGVRARVLKRPKNYASLIRQLSSFAAVVTTSYHGALGGIYGNTPVICVSNNEYYKMKFKGLSEVFNGEIVCVGPEGMDNAFKKLCTKTGVIRDFPLKSRINELIKLNEEIYSKIAKNL